MRRILIALLIFSNVAHIWAQHSKNHSVVLLKHNEIIGTGWVLKTQTGALVLTNQHVKALLEGKIQIGKAKPIWSVSLTGPNDPGAVSMFEGRVKANPVRDLAFIFFQESPEQLGLTALEISFTHPKMNDPVSFTGYLGVKKKDFIEDSKIGTILGLSNPTTLLLSFPSKEGNSGSPVLDSHGRVVATISGENTGMAQAIRSSFLVKGVLANPKLKALFSNEDLLKMQIFVAEKKIDR